MRPDPEVYRELRETEGLTMSEFPEEFEEYVGWAEPTQEEFLRWCRNRSEPQPVDVFLGRSAAIGRTPVVEEPDAEFWWFLVTATALITWVIVSYVQS